MRKQIIIILTTTLFLLISFYAIGLFKHISYPLLWNDEAITAMFASRILQFGYPKVNDGKNILNFTEVLDKGLGVKEEIDAWIHTGWGQFYFATPGVFLAQNVSNLYQKTALTRIPFALAGLISIGIFAFVGLAIFKNVRERLIFLNIFFFFELMSVSTVLHMREVRSYSVTFLLLSILMLCTIYYVIKQKLHPILFAFVCILFSFLLFATYPPASVAFILTLIIYALLDFAKKRKFSPRLQTIGVSLTLLFALLIPFAWYFETFHISSEVSRLNNFDITRYIQNISHILRFFLKHEYLALAIIVKLLTFLIFTSYKIITVAIKKQLTFATSNFLSLFFVISILVVARIPYMFDRYIIFLQPVLMLILLFDSAMLYKLIFPKKIPELFESRWRLVTVVGTFFLLSSLTKIPTISGHLHELTHQYKGPLDFAIFFIDEQFENTDQLIIATNYEEASYMYYLNSRVTVGFVGNNLADDSKTTPDIVIPRRGRPNNVEVLGNFLQNGEYDKTTFPIYDSQVNNIPELTLVLNHRFKTKLPSLPDEELEIFINEKTKVH